MRILLFVFVLVLVNLPYAHERWTDHRITSRGVDVAAIVVAEREVNDGYLVDYRLPSEIDPRQRAYSAAVDLPTYENARATDRIAVRVVPGEPEANRPLGLVASSLFGVIAIVANLVLALIAAALWWRRGRPSGWAAVGRRT